MQHECREKVNFITIPAAENGITISFALPYLLQTFISL
jgi:hypothetical protein